MNQTQTAETSACLRQRALQALAIAHWDDKSALVLALPAELSADTTAHLQSSDDLPGRLPLPELVSPKALRQHSVSTREGRAALIHALCHIELNAVNLALDAVWRFADLPADYYRDWTGVAQEEAQHFQLLQTHLHSLGYRYGDFPAHNGLWEMAEKTAGDVLARMALVPRTLEARGLDASLPIRDKLLAVGDGDGAAILDRILHDEIGHVAIGNHWYRWLCQQRGLDPMASYASLAQQYQAPRLRGPFNLEARRAAGFEEGELAALFDA